MVRFMIPVHHSQVVFEPSNIPVAKAREKILSSFPGAVKARVIGVSTTKRKVIYLVERILNFEIKNPVGVTPNSEQDQG